MEELQKTKIDICGRLKILKDTGVRLSDIESGIGLSKNSLSGILSGIKVFPTRHIPSALEYLEQGGKRQKMKQIPLDEWEQIEAKLMELELLKTQQLSKSVIDKTVNHLLETGIAITETTEEGVRAIHPMSEEGFRVQELVETQSLISQYQEELSRLGTSPIAKQRRKWLENKIRELQNHTSTQS